MAEVVKQFSYNSTLEDWVFTPVGSATGTRDTTEDSPNDSNAGTGVMQNRTAGKNQNTAGSYWEWGNGTLNWESLGVPAGATVTAVNLAYDWKCSEFNIGSANDTGPAELRDGAGTLRNTFSTALGFSTTTAWAARSGTAITGLSEASSTTIRLRITGSTRTGASSSAVVTLRQDWVVVTITYSGGGTGYPYVGSGGIQFGGAATTRKGNTYHYVGSGGVQFAGAATTKVYHLIGAYTGTGGIQFAGAATTKVYHLIGSYTGSGGIQFGGAATTRKAHGFAYLPNTLLNNWLVSLAVGQNSPRGMIHLSGYLYVLCQQSPSLIVKIEVANPANRSVLTFPSDEYHNGAFDLTYIPAKGRLYVTFGSYFLDQKVTIAEVNPSDLSYSDVISDANYYGPDSLTFDSTYLYVNGWTDDPLGPHILRYSLTDFSFQGVIDTSDCFNSLRYDGTKLYGVDRASPNPASVFRINTSTWAIEEEAQLPAGCGAGATAMAFTTDYLWVGIAGASTYRGSVVRVLKSDLTSSTVINTGTSMPCNGVFCDGTYVWALLTYPSRLARINANTLRVDIFPFSNGQDAATKMALFGYTPPLVDDETGYFAFAASPAKVSAITLTGLVTGLEFGGAAVTAYTAAGGNIYNESFSIGVSQGLSKAAALNAVGAFSLAGSAGIQKSSQLDALASFSAAITAGITKQGVTIIPVSTSLEITAGFSEIGGLNLDGAFTLAAQAGLSAAGALLIYRALALAASSGLSVEAANQLLASLGLDVSAITAIDGALDIPATFTAAVQAAVTAAGGLNLDEGFSVAAQAGFSAGVALVIPVNISLGGVAGVSASSQLEAVAALTFPVAKSLQVTPQLVIDSALALAGVLDLALVGGGDFTEALTLAVQSGALLAGSLAIPAVFQLQLSADQELQAQALFESGLNLAAQVDQGVSGVIEIDKAFSLGVQADQQIAGGMAFSGTFSLDAEAGQSFLASVDFGAYLNLGAQAGVGVIPQLIAVAAFSLDATLAAQLRGNLEIGAALTLSVTVAAQIEGELQVVQIPAELVITDEALVSLTLGNSVALAVLLISDSAEADIQAGTTMATYDIGDVAKLTATIAVDSTPTDPATVQVTVNKPSGASKTYVFGTDPEVTKPAVGSYLAAIPIDESGIWWYEWACTNPNGTEENSLTVRTSKV